MKTANYIQNPFSKAYNKHNKQTHYLDSFYNSHGILYTGDKNYPIINWR